MTLTRKDNTMKMVTRFLLAALLALVSISWASAQQYSVVEVVPTEVYSVEIIESNVEVTYLEGYDSVAMPEGVIAAVCDGDTVRISDVPVADLTVRYEDGQLFVGQTAVEFICPPAPLSAEVQALFPVLANHLPGYGWDDEFVLEIWTAFDAGEVEVYDVVINEDNSGWYDETWASPHGRRWSETNFIAHLRDEHPNGVQVVVVTLPTGNRVSLILNGCGEIEKVAIGVKPVPQAPAPRQQQQPPVQVVQDPPQQNNRPAPGAGIQMICTAGCQ